MAKESSRVVKWVGKVIVGNYPAANYHGVPLRYERRRVLVESVRVIEAEPLDAETLRMNPLLRRSGVLITGRDLDRDAERSFYIDSFEKPPRVQTLMQALRVDSDDNRFVVAIVPRPKRWRPTKPTELPPGVRMIRSPNFRTAQMFASEFNRRMIDEHRADWAITVLQGRLQESDG